MKILKKILFVLTFVVVTLILPSVIMLGLVDSAENFAVYVIVYAVIIFAILGYIVLTMHEMSKTLRDSLDEIKKQNAAIAYRLTSGVQSEDEERFKESEKNVAEDNTPKAKVNLNPEEDFVSQKVSTTKNEDIDDFE